jgi:glucosamine-phosphate N-acetyltransferase
MSTSPDTCSNVSIRLMDATDLDHGFLETLASLSEPGLTREQAIDVLQVRMRRRVLTFVAVVESRVVGTAALIVEPKFLHGGRSAGHIEDVAVHRDFQSRGIGSALVRHLLEYCRTHQCYKVVLDCQPDLVGYYRQLGFREWSQGMRLDYPLEPA